MFPSSEPSARRPFKPPAPRTTLDTSHGITAGVNSYSLGVFNLPAFVTSHEPFPKIRIQPCTNSSYSEHMINSHQSDLVLRLTQIQNTIFHRMVLENRAPFTLPRLGGIESLTTHAPPRYTTVRKVVRRLTFATIESGVSRENNLGSSRCSGGGGPCSVRLSWNHRVCLLRIRRDSDLWLCTFLRHSLALSLSCTVQVQVTNSFLLFVFFFAV